MQMPALGPAQTNAVLAGPLCDGSQCVCREDAKKKTAGEPDEGLKRYEVRVGPSGNELRVQVGPHQIYKSAERPVDCFYVDLPTGQHVVSLRASGDPSFGAGMSIREMGGGAKHWYRTFDFECGINVCAIDDLKEWRRDVAKLGAKHDPCGSTKVTSVNYQTGRLPDGLRPADLFLTATLQVYDFQPSKPPCPGS